MSLSLFEFLEDDELLEMYPLDGMGSSLLSLDELGMRQAPIWACAPGISTLDEVWPSTGLSFV